MTTLNPFSGWPNPGGSGSPAVLPPSQQMKSHVLTFRYVELSPDVLNCTIIGPDSLPWLEVITAPNGPRTIFRHLGNGAAAYIIDWTRPLSVQVNGQPESKHLGHWLGLQVDQNRQAMNVGGASYTWLQRDNGICLDPVGAPARNPPLARIYRIASAITLELTTEAFGLGLLDAAVVATVAIHSGRLQLN